VLLPPRNYVRQLVRSEALHVIINEFTACGVDLLLSVGHFVA